MTLDKPRKKPVNSCRKGKLGELDFAHALTAAGYPAERGQQHAGGSDSPDVRCPSLGWVHFEVKRTATCHMFAPKQIAKWEAQAIRDAGEAKLPVIAHRWNGQSTWWVRVLRKVHSPYWMTLTDFLEDRRAAVIP